MECLHRLVPFLVTAGAPLVSVALCGGHDLSSLSWTYPTDTFAPPKEPRFASSEGPP